VKSRFTIEHWKEAVKVAMNTAIRQHSGTLALVTAAVAWQHIEENCSTDTSYKSQAATRVWCEAAQSSLNKPPAAATVAAGSPSWIRRKLLAPIGIPLPVPRVVMPKDPALTLPKRYIQRRLKDEERMRQLLEKAPTLGRDPEKMKALGEEIFEVTYGKGVTAQAREDFLLRYGCTGWTEKVLETLVDLCETRGIVEIGAGHGQWARALSEAFDQTQKRREDEKRMKRFDFVLAYDDMSDLPLNTHIYNPYTQPHHDYFGNVQKLETKTKMMRVLQSWACRGRALLLVYPPPGEMATEVVQQYVDAAPQNDTVIFVGEGRGGANACDSFFDYFEGGDWVLLSVLELQRPPGDKGYEKLYILQRSDA